MRQNDKNQKIEQKMESTSIVYPFIQEEKHGKKKIYIYFIVTLFFLFLNRTYLYANGTYEKIAEIKCEDYTVKIITECLNIENKAFPFCVSQEILFVNVREDKILKKPASGVLVKDNNKSILDALVSKIACVRGYKGSYLIIEYYNGGNCDACEWYEVFDLSGNRLTSSKNDSIEGQNQNSKKTYNELGLPKKWPRSLFMNVNLLKSK